MLLALLGQLQAAPQGLRDDLVHLRVREHRPGLSKLGTPLWPGSPWLRVRTSDAAGLAARLEAEPWVHTAVQALAPQPPPEDIPPETPDLTGEQIYWGPAPDGLGVWASADWPGADGRHVAVADLEYSWDPEHEDLGATVGARTWGHDAGTWAFHGNAVLSLLVAQDDGYGLTGAAPAAEPVVVFPYVEEDDYDIAAAVAGAATLLEPGDVLLIEQQAYANGNYAPVSVSPAVHDAIAAVVEAGIVVVEAAGNGGQDLDDEGFEGWFDREQRDHGGILVGGGASPLDPWTETRGWTGGSNHGSRVDVQAWYSYTTVAATTGAYQPDLFYGDSDDRQAYTTQFGGTSGAAAMVAGLAAAFQSAAMELGGEPWAPRDLRALMVSTGTPQDPDTAQHLGPQPDLLRMLWWGLPR